MRLISGKCITCSMNSRTLVGLPDGMVQMMVDHRGVVDGRHVQHLELGEAVVLAEVAGEVVLGVLPPPAVHDGTAYQLPPDVGPQVLLQVVLPQEPFVALVAVVLFLPRVVLLVLPQVDGLLEGQPAVGALEGLLLGVGEPVPVQDVPPLEALAAHVAHERLLVPVYPAVLDEVGPVGERGGAQGAGEGPDARVDAHVNLEVVAVAKTFAALEARHLLALTVNLLVLKRLLLQHHQAFTSVLSILNNFLIRS